MVCTDSETFTLHMVETSNTLILADVPSLGADGDPLAGAGAIELAGIVACAYEAKPTPPRVNLLGSLLKRSAMTLEEATRLAEEPVGDEILHTDSATVGRSRQGGDASATSAIETAHAETPTQKRSRSSAADAAAPSTAGISTPAATAPVSVISSSLKREKEAVAGTKQFSLAQLEAVIQASRGEIVAELTRMGAVEHRGESVVCRARAVGHGAHGSALAIFLRFLWCVVGCHVSQACGGR